MRNTTCWMLGGVLALALAAPSDGANDVPRGSIEGLLAQVPASLMPQGTMTPEQATPFQTWAKANLAGEPVHVGFVVGAVEGAADEATVVTGYLPLSAPLHGRTVLCKVRAELAAAGEESGFSLLTPGTKVYVTGQTAADHPLEPTTGTLPVNGKPTQVSGWTADRAYLAVNLVQCRGDDAKEPETPAPRPPRPAAKASAPPVPAAPAPKSKPKREPAKEAPAEGETPPVKATTFFKVSSGTAKRVVYIGDRSGSMTDCIDYVKYEMKRSIAALSPEHAFAVIFYSAGPPVVMTGSRHTEITADGRTGETSVTHVHHLLGATEENKRAACTFIDGIIPQGETDPSHAIDVAFEADPEAVFLLSDGEFDKAIVDRIRRLNPEKRTVVHTIGFFYRTGELVLKKIAEENGGQYKFVSEGDLRTLADPPGEGME